MSESRQKPIKPMNLHEFREGAREFVKELSKCPQCAIKLALELANSNGPEDRQLLKNLLVELSRKIMELEESYRASHSVLDSFPLIGGVLRGEIGLGIIAKLFRRQSNED